MKRDDDMKKMSMKSAFLLSLTAFIWGTAFVAQSTGMDYIGPFTFSCLRNLMGGAFLIPCIMILDKLGSGESKEKRRAHSKEERKELLIGGIACGIALFVASNLQQFGIQYTSAGKAGFITALYIVLVPIFGLFFRKKIGMKVWISIMLAIVGLYFLCITEGFTIGKGDLYVFLCAIGFAIHIMIIDYFSSKVDGVRMSCIQFWITGSLSAIPMLIFETPTLSAIISGFLPLAYAGIMSSGVAYTLQIVGQKDADPTLASLILSLESVFAVLAGWMILGEQLSMRELTGCALMFAAIILSQLPDKTRLPF